jgi:hypothetical protein
MEIAGSLNNHLIPLVRKYAFSPKMRKFTESNRLENQGIFPSSSICEAAGKGVPSKL